MGRRWRGEGGGRRRAREGRQWRCEVVLQRHYSPSVSLFGVSACACRCADTLVLAGRPSGFDARWGDGGSLEGRRLNAFPGRRCLLEHGGGSGPATDPGFFWVSALIQSGFGMHSLRFSQ